MRPNAHGILRIATLTSIEGRSVLGFFVPGQVAEWLKAPVSKTGIRLRRIESSNLSLSVSNYEGTEGGATRFARCAPGRGRREQRAETQGLG